MSTRRPPVKSSTRLWLGVVAAGSLAGCGAVNVNQLGTVQRLLPERDPLVLAKQCATIDFLSNGRLLPMFGVGYPNAIEWKTTNRDASDRGARSSEIFQLLNMLWTQESVTFEGKFYQYRNSSPSWDL